MKSLQKHERQLIQKNVPLFSLTKEDEENSGNRSIRNYVMGNRRKNTCKNHESKRMRFNLFFSSSRKAFKMTKKDVPQETLEMGASRKWNSKNNKSMSREKEKKGKEEEAGMNE